MEENEERASVTSDWDSLSIEDQGDRVLINPLMFPPIEITRTSPAPTNSAKSSMVSGERLDPFGGHSYLRVPGMASGRTSPSVVSMSSEPESCIDDMRYMQEDDEIDYG